MKKSKTTKTTKKSYSSVKELLEDNNSKIKLTPFNCKEAKFGKIIVMPNPYCSNQKFNIIFSRASTSSKFFENIENRIPNQILWNEEEQQAYFLNSDKQLYKILFEPVPMEKQKTNQTTEEYMNSLKKSYLKQEIKNIAIPWSKFHNPSPNLFDRTYDTKLLTPMLIDLLDSIIEHKNQKVYHFTVSPRVNAFIESLMNYEWNTKSFIFKDKLFFVHVDVYNPKTELIFQNIKFIE